MKFFLSILLVLTGCKFSQEPLRDTATASTFTKSWNCKYTNKIEGFATCTSLDGVEVCFVKNSKDGLEIFECFRMK